MSISRRGFLKGLFGAIMGGVSLPKIISAEPLIEIISNEEFDDFKMMDRLQKDFRKKGIRMIGGTDVISYSINKKRPIQYWCNGKETHYGGFHIDGNVVLRLDGFKINKKMEIYGSELFYDKPHLLILPIRNFNMKYSEKSSLELICGGEIIGNKGSFIRGYYSGWVRFKKFVLNIGKHSFMTGDFDFVSIDGIFNFYQI